MFVTDSDNLVHITLGSTTSVLIGKLIWDKFFNGRNGKSKVHSFAEHPDLYWEAMRNTVTEPLSKILDSQTRILQEQVRGNNEIMLKLVALDERTKK